MSSSRSQVSPETLWLRPRWFRVLLLVVSWTGFGIFMAAQSYYLLLRSGHPIPWGRALFQELVYAYLWAALTPVIFTLARRYPIQLKHWGSRFSLHVVAGVLIAVVHKVCFHVIIMSVDAVPGRGFSLDRLLSDMWTYLDYGILLYWLILILRHTAEFYQRYREKEIHASQLEAQLTRAQLDALKMQLQPHFLFNTLNAISVLIGRHPDTARRMISKLADLLRITLESSTKHEIPLEQELVFLKSYLEIEETRFEDRLSVELDIAPETLGALVPNLLLQPIVENAMRHGVAEHRGPTRVAVRSLRQNGSLKLEVCDNGPGIRSAPGKREGIGFSNTRSRLAQLYGAASSFEVANAPEGGAVATIIIPFRREGEEQQ